ncbi:MAG TPA: M50 family metallopeptidase [Solirubrobacterales bacterium]
MSWLLVVAGFSALIVLHEFGHFIVAKWTGMRVERFFLFFPPRLWSVKRGETEYGIGMIPLGGFVKITGMNPEELEPRNREEEPREAGFLERIESVDQDEGPGVSRPGEPLPPELLERAYYNQPVWKRVVVIAAGPVVNVLIAFLILFGLSFGLDQASGSGVEVGQLTEDSPAAGKLKPGDQVVSIDGVAAANLEFEDRIDGFRDQINGHACAGEPTEGCRATTPVELVVERDGKRVPVTVTPEYSAEAERYLVGIAFAPVDTEPLAGSLTEGGDYAVDTMWFITRETVSTIGQIFLPEKREQLSGPVGGGRALNEAIGFGTQEALLILALISLSLGIINLFPFLPLDGGHIFWSLVEKFRGERVPFSVIERASAVGFLLILMLFFVGLTNDLGRLGDDALNPR